jgi:hypothetical protein
MPRSETNTKGAKKVSTPSHVEIKCKQCDGKIQKRSLTEHYSHFHEGKDYRECLISEKGNLDAFFKKPLVESTETEESSSTKQKTDNVTVQDLPSPNESKDTSKSSLDDVVFEISQLKLGQEKILSVIQEKQILHSTSSTTSHSSQLEVYDIQHDLYKSHNVEELVENIDWLIITDNNENARCLVCTSDDQQEDDHQPGFFNVTQEFRFLKKHVKVHSTRKVHCQNLSKSEIASYKSLRLSKRSDKVGMLLGTLGREFHRVLISIPLIKYVSNPELALYT